ncbi:MAG TPA: phosphate ABC transporter substrate-binding protein PstS [Candidatus Acidoferrum sp.]|nr:phosphate ABC transporter substrate-binding protein PstS [Candidatus Acidoferrum sp.]
MLLISHPQTASRDFLWKFLLGLMTLSAFLIPSERGARAQTAESLSQVKKVYVESFGPDEAAGNLREKTIQQLRKNKKFEVLPNPGGADAIVKGNGSIWVTGYMSTNPRAPASARQAIYHGFLSVEVVGKNSEPLWSYLATPGKLRAGSITDDLAEQIVTRLSGALEHSGEKVPAVPSADQSLEFNLHGAGATLPAPLYQKWFESFQQRNAQARISYNAVGSEGGLRMLAEGKVDFAASDVPLSDERMAQSKSPLLHFPTVLGAVVPIYNVKGAEPKLNFTPETLAGIYLGKIKKWNDPKIRAANKNASLPDAEIIVVHRSDGSGTTFVWTDYLSKVSPDWKKTVGAGSEVQWPAGTGAEGNEAVAAMVQQTPNSIGYVELVYALRHQLSFGAVRNAAGEYVLADLTSVTVAAKGAAGAMTSDFRVSITDAPGKGAYPIATFTWWLVPQDLGGAGKKPAFVELLKWVLTSGQNDCSALGYAPLPKEIANRELQFLATLK